MKLIVTIYFLCIALFACKGKIEIQKEKISETVRKYINDYAFKDNSNVEFHEFKLLRVDTTNENYIDTLRLVNNEEFKERFTREADELQSKIKKDMATLKLYAAAHYKDLFEYSNAEMSRDIEKLKSYSDSIRKHYLRDSLIRTDIKSRINPKTIYATKFFIKATQHKGLQKHNLLDTVNFYVKDDLKSVIDVSTLIKL